MNFSPLISSAKADAPVFCKNILGRTYYLEGQQGEIRRSSALNSLVEPWF